MCYNMCWIHFQKSNNEHLDLKAIQQSINPCWCLVSLSKCCFKCAWRLIKLHINRSFIMCLLLNLVHLNFISTLWKNRSFATRLASTILKCNDHLQFIIYKPSIHMQLVQLCCNKIIVIIGPLCYNYYVIKF